ncbi:hypothetical protein L5I01_17605 [Gordonia sp. HY442]|uniref:hypothetical protein n=1 Tax=Gordonia zhenghanii TaxID=2911516 RepID=UPI001F21A2EE|nr:hypothetical protein [Gordonia zhenghanii]MCF8605173.1 hypothetical protein [Gordonia zhenghanii]
MKSNQIARAAAIVGAVVALTLVTACGSSIEDAATKAAESVSQSVQMPGDEGTIKPVGEIIRGESGTTIELKAVTQQGDSTVLTVKFTAGKKNLEGYNILNPVLTYGDEGLEAKVNYNLTDTVDGIIAAGTPRTVEFAYDVPKAKLNTATLTMQIGLASAGWRGDLTKVKAAKPTPTATQEVNTEPEPTQEAPEPTSTLPEGWDKDGDGQIDTDAPVGDVGCDTAECLIEKNDQGGATTQPTFDPNSADGYGPNQKLPPLCERFPQDYGPC